MRAEAWRLSASPAEWLGPRPAAFWGSAARPALGSAPPPCSLRLPVALKLPRSQSWRRARRSRAQRSNDPSCPPSLDESYSSRLGNARKVRSVSEREAAGRSEAAAARVCARKLDVDALAGGASVRVRKGMLVNAATVTRDGR